MRMLCWNVNGIRAAHKKGFLNWMTKESPDIMCLQETKAAEDQLPEDLRDVPGYHSYFASPKEKGGYSGVALYTKTEPDQVRFGMGVDRFDVEGRIIAATYPGFVLYNIYFPNGKASSERLRYKMDFYEAFLDIVTERSRRGDNIVVCGDVNTAHKEIDLARPKENQRISGFLPEETGMDGPVRRRRLHRYLPGLRPITGEVHLVGHEDQGQGEERGLAHRLFLCVRELVAATARRLHTRIGAGIGPLSCRHRGRPLKIRFWGWGGTWSDRPTPIPVPQP